MGGGRYKPSLSQMAVVQILCFVLLAALPIIWVVIILRGLLYIMLRPSSFIEFSKDTGQNIWIATAIPFAFSYEHYCFFRYPPDDEDDPDYVRETFGNEDLAADIQCRQIS